MRILHIINNLGSGGAEKLIREMLPLVNKKEDIQADVLLLTDKGNVFDEELKKNGVKVEVIQLKNPYNPINAYYVRKYINKGKYDIVHVHLFPSIYWVSIASRLILKYKPKFIYTEHSTHNRRRDKSYLRPLEKLTYSNYDKIISISDSTQENLIKWLESKQEDLNKFVVINNGINIDKFKEAEAYGKKEINDKFNSDTKLLCMVGRFSEAKDQATIIRSMKSLTEDIHLLLVGEGPLKEQNERLAEEIGVRNRVHFLGFRNDVERILKTSDIVIQSSNWEGFGLAAVEGMASEKPVIASDILGLREVVEGAGMLFERGNEVELSDKIRNLIGNRESGRDVSNKCINRADLFDISIMTKNILKEYEDIL